MVFPTPGTPASRIIRDLVGLKGVRRAEGAVVGDSVSKFATGTRGTLLTLPVFAICEFRQDARACQRKFLQTWRR